MTNNPNLQNEPNFQIQNRRIRVLNRVLWGAQILLAVTFLFTGLTKLLVPIPMLQAQMPIVLPGAFLRFLGLAETLGAIAMILPGVLRFRTGLTALAAAGLVIIMIGATAYTIIGGPAVEALMPFVVGLLAVFVAYGRWRLAPLTGSVRLALLRPLAARA
jgi:DoxX-like protein